MYQCTICSKRLRTLDQLTNHQRLHTEEKVYKCTERIELKKSDIITHMNWVETGEVTVNDEKKNLDDVIHSDPDSKITDQKSKEETEGKLHQFNKYDDSLRQVKILQTGNRTFSKETPYQCKECGMSFTQASIFKSHQKIHTGEKPFQCEQCGKSFKQTSDLKKHKRIHTGEKPYQCVQCGKSFTRSSNLKRHKRTHTANQCTFCSKGFRTKNHLKHHQCLLTEEKSDNCTEEELKKADFTSVNWLETVEVTVNDEKQDLDGVIHSVVEPEISPDSITSLNCGEALKPTGIDVKKESDDEVYSDQESKSADQRCKGETEEQLQQFKYDNSVRQVKILQKGQRNYSTETHYQCEECGRSFTQASDFKIHKRTHTANLFYRALYSKYLTTLGQMKYHQREHTDEKLYKCIAVVELKKSDIITPIHCGKTLETTGIHVKKELDEEYSDERMSEHCKTDSRA
ncbi:zinc finger protein 708-like [Denticeps clupeoides]|nr:zinc finger protein 708-like [Denticeps clupeoides]